MAASMWRMNGLWKGVALALMLCALQLNHGVMCDEDAVTDTPAADPGATDAADAAAPDATAAPDAPADDTGATAAADNAGTDAPGDQSADGTVAPNADSRGDNGDTSGTSGTSAAPLAVNVINMDATEAAAETRALLNLVIPAVQCVDKEALEGKDTVKVKVTTADCEATKAIIQGAPAAWCGKDNCRLDINQDGNTVLVASPDAEGQKLVMALQSDNIYGPLGVSETEYSSASSGSSVFVAVLLTGLLLAAALIGAYCLKYRRASDTKGIRLAEEACPADEQNQGNTLVSVAPLNPPPETPEKPIVNGDSPEAAKIEPPPTNGHSTAKTADTEL